MNAVEAFVDTNILVYAHDPGQGEKQRIAQALLERLWERGSGAVSTQVLQEFYVNVRRKVRSPLTRQQALACLEDFFSWRVVVNGELALRGAVDIEDRFGLSFWDALVVQAAQSCGAQILYSEDLSHGQSYGSVRVVNPFRS